MHSVSKNLDEHSDKISDDVKAEVEELADAKELMTMLPPRKSKEKVSALSAVSMKIGQAMYKGGEQGAAPEPTPRLPVKLRLRKPNTKKKMARKRRRRSSRRNVRARNDLYFEYLVSNQKRFEKHYLL